MKNVFLGLALIFLVSCDQGGKKKDFGQKRIETFDQVYSLGGDQTLKITWLDSASIRYQLDFTRSDIVKCKGSMEGVAVYMNPEPDLETEADTAGTFPVEEFVHEAEEYFLTIRLQYPERKKASVQAEASGKKICLPSKEVMRKQEVQ